MKRSVVFAIVLAALAALGFQAKPAKPPKQLPCPIMKQNKVDLAKATTNKLFTDYKGRRYFFCCAGCPQAFKADPEKYKKSPSVPAPKKPVAK